MSKLTAAVTAFVKGEDGATMIEYGLMVALIAVVLIATVVLMTTALNTTFTKVTYEMYRAA